MGREEQDLDGDLLFVGLTRPAMILGVPYVAVVAEAMALGLLFLQTGNLFLLLLAAPVHAVLYLVSASDPAIFGSIAIWALTTARCRNRAFWSAASFAPLRAKNSIEK